MDLNADVCMPGADGATTYTTSLPLDGAARVPGDAFAVLHAMALVGGLLGGASALHCGPDGVPHAKQPELRQVSGGALLL